MMLQKKARDTVTPIKLDLIIDDPLWKGNMPNEGWESFFKKLYLHVLEQEDISIKDITLSLFLTNNGYIKNLNRDYRGKDKATNVLSFPAADFEMVKRNPDMPIHLGDIVMAYETIEKEALTQSKSLFNHNAHLFIHGLLHLLGYDHIDDHDANIMEEKEINYLNAFNIQNPYLEVEQ